MHGAEERGDVDIAPGVPLVLVDATVELGADLAIGPLGGRPLRGGNDRLVEAGGWALTQRDIDVAQVQPKEAVPDLVHAGIVRPAKPPEPVAAFGDQDFATRGRQLRAIGVVALAVAEKVA